MTEEDTKPSMTSQAFDDLRAKWLTEAREVSTPQQLGTFLEMLANHPHDYNTCVEATVAALLATMRVMSKRLGLTGFQASVIALKVAAEIMVIRGPLKLIRYEQMLYPQNEHYFAREISPDTWSWLRAAAESKVKFYLEEKDPHVHPAVLEHWKSILSFKIPFGYTLEKARS